MKMIYLGQDELQFHLNQFVADHGNGVGAAKENTDANTAMLKAHGVQPIDQQTIEEIQNTPRTRAISGEIYCVLSKSIPGKAW